MEYAKITITPKSPFVSLLQSDTIFGHFAWGVRFIFGEKKLEELLTDFNKNPFIVFSDGFIKDLLPKPFLKPYMPKDTEIKDAKKIKKIGFIEKKFIFENISDLTDEKIFKYLKDKEYFIGNKSEITQKNSINRFSNIVTEGLYSIKESFLKTEFEIYFAYQNITKNEIEEVFNYISKKGYGKDKSTGKGKFEYKFNWDFEEKNYFTTKKSKFLSLSTCFYDNKNMLLYYGKTITKYPKTGGIYAFSKPYKNPCIMYQPGSTFLVKDNIAGKAEDTLFNEPNHFQNGYTIGIYFDGE